MRKRGLFILVIIISCVFSLPGCGKKEHYPPGARVIKLWTASNPYEIEWASGVVKAWNESHPDVYVSSQPIPEGRSSEEILMASVLARTTPDICANLSPTVVERFRRAGALVALDDYPLLMNALRERVPEESFRFFISPDGRLYQVPWKCNPIAMFCNMRLFREAGASPPATYSEWLKAAGLIQKGAKGSYMTFFDTSITWYKRFFDFYTLYIAASGGKTLLDETGEPDIMNPAALSVMTFLRENFEKGYAPLEITPGDPFIFQRVAVNISGPWNVAFIDQAGKGIDYDIFPVPVPDECRDPGCTFADPKCMGIFTTTKYPRDCAEFVAFMCNRDNDAHLVSTCSQLVYRKNLLDDEAFRGIFEKAPMLKKFARMVPSTRSVDHSAEIMELFDALSMEYVDIAVRRLRSPEEGLKRAQETMRAIETANKRP
jgi:multiple sugar transport system substrate-binding protein